jgi:hypothetical protein
MLCNPKEVYLIFKQQIPVDLLGFSEFSESKTKNLLAGVSGTTCKMCIPVMRMWNIWLSSKKHDFAVRQVKTYDKSLSRIICNVLIVSYYQGDCKMCPGPKNLIRYWAEILRQYYLETVDGSWKQLCNLAVTFSSLLQKMWYSGHQHNKYFKINQSSCLHWFYITNHDTHQDGNRFYWKVKHPVGNILLHHSFITWQKSCFYKQLKLKLKTGGIVVAFYFSENYYSLIKDEI